MVRGRKKKTKARHKRIAEDTLKIVKKVDSFRRNKNIKSRANKFQRGGQMKFTSSDVYMIYGDVFKCALVGEHFIGIDLKTTV